MVWITVYSLVHYGINTRIRIPCIESTLNEPLEPPLLCPSWKLWRVLSKNATCNMHMNLPDLIHEEHQRAPFLWQDSVRNSSLCNLRVLSGYEFPHLLDSTQCSPSVTSHVADAILWYILKAPTSFAQRFWQNLVMVVSFQFWLTFFFVKFPHHHCDIIAVFPTIHLDQLSAASIGRHRFLPKMQLGDVDWTFQLIEKPFHVLLMAGLQAQHRGILPYYRHKVFIPQIIW